MISVIIPTRQRPALVQEALASLADQTFTDFEVVLVNDGSPSLEACVHPWRQHLDLSLVELPEHGGVSRARNEGIDRAAGEYLAFLDDDDIFLPHHLDTAHKHLTSGVLDFVYLGALVAGRRLRALPDDRTGMPTKAYGFDEDFLRDLRWSSCQARSGCCNKEDFLNLKLWNEHPRPAVPSLGWTRS